MVERNDGSNKAACTDVLCSRDGARMKGDEPAPIAQINFYGKDSSARVSTNNAPQRRATREHFTQVLHQLLVNDTAFCDFFARL